MMRLLGVMLFAAGVSLPLLAQEKMGSLAVKADPGRAGVFLDGKYLGPAKNFGVARTYTGAVLLREHRHGGERSIPNDDIAVPIGSLM